MKTNDKNEDDDKIWQAVASTVKPLKGRQSVVFETKSCISLEKKLTVDARHFPHTPDIKIGIFEELTEGDIHFTDRNTGERFKKGKMNIDAVLDLHGFILEKAFEKLRNFLYTQSQSGARCVLVITGKGLDGRGILRAELPKWLNHAEIRGLILSFSKACPKDGGSGAFYILLKRNRF